MENWMNKTLFSITFMLFLSLPLFAQNPDGKNASLHVTPLWNWGNSTFSRATYIWSPPTQASDEQTVKTDEYGTLKYPYAFGISASIKIPPFVYFLDRRV